MKTTDKNKEYTSLVTKKTDKRILMTISLFEAIKILHQKLSVDHLDIHSAREELQYIVELGRQNEKLRIITQYLAVLEALARNYEYEDAQTIARIKILILQFLELILEMVNGSISNDEGAVKLENYLEEARNLLGARLGTESFLHDAPLLEQMSNDLVQDVKHIRDIFKTPILAGQINLNYDSVLYYLNRCYEHMEFLDLVPLKDLIKALLEYTVREFKHGNFTALYSQADFLLSLEYLEKRAQFFLGALVDKKAIMEHLEENQPKNIVTRLKKNPYESREQENQLNPFNVILTDEEVYALMNNEQDFEIISFDNDEDTLPAQTETLDKKESVDNSTVISLEEYLTVKKKTDSRQKALPINPVYSLPLKDQEDILIKYIGRLFQKQEQLKSWLTEEATIEKIDDIQEIDNITKSIKEMIFDQYYTNMESLMGTELREYIYDEVKKMDKKIRLGIRGEQSEVLTRESEFVKHIVYSLVKNALHHSIEPIYRRRAIDKSETSWLLIEFEDVGNNFDIYIRDDGRGLVPEQMNITELQDQVINKGGYLEVDSMENEYLKIHVSLPMKRILMDCLVVEVQDTFVLIPNRCVSRLVELKDIDKALRDEQCIGQLNLGTALGFDFSPSKMYIVCVFGTSKVLYGIEKVHYSMEALIENIDTPLISCSDEVAILKDGSLGFIINEKLLYEESKTLIAKRASKDTFNLTL